MKTAPQDWARGRPLAGLSVSGISGRWAQERAAEGRGVNGPEVKSQRVETTPRRNLATQSIQLKLLFNRHC